jgi:hypothetical protein
MNIARGLKTLYQEPAPYQLLALFLRGVGAIYFISYISMLLQIRGLIGQQGIFPANQLAQLTGAHLPNWLVTHDWPLLATILISLVLSILVMRGSRNFWVLAGLWSIRLLFFFWANYFFANIWDRLLAEVGFLAIFLCRLDDAPVASLWVLRFLFFRVVFSMGWVKLTSSAPAWLNLTFIRDFYQNQPSPSWISWYLYQAPTWLIQIQSALVLLIEGPLAFFILLPYRLRVLRLFYFGIHGLFQLMIFLSGDFGYFQPLMLVLSITLLDETLIHALLKMPIQKTKAITRSVRMTLITLYTSLTFVSSFWLVHIVTRPQLSFAFVDHMWVHSRQRYIPTVFRDALFFLDRLKISSTYDLFSHLPPHRFEIQISGSHDGQTWRDYDFHYKPGRTDQAPRWSTPYLFRLDQWMFNQAYAEAYPDVVANLAFFNLPWFPRFLQGLLEARPGVISLLPKNSFFDHPPTKIRADLYEYHFTSYEERRQTGQWWSRQFVKEVLRLQKGQPLPDDPRWSIRAEILRAD